MSERPVRAARCGTCAFWDRLSDRAGYCRRNAPAALDARDLAAHWPSTGQHERCGEGIEAGAGVERMVRCGDCVFWQCNPGGGLDPQNRRDERIGWWRKAGYCFRHAPNPTADPGNRGFWFATHEDDRCGMGEAADHGN